VVSAMAQTLAFATVDSMVTNAKISTALVLNTCSQMFAQDMVLVSQLTLVLAQSVVVTLVPIAILQFALV